MERCPLFFSITIGCHVETKKTIHLGGFRTFITKIRFQVAGLKKGDHLCLIVSASESFGIGSYKNKALVRRYFLL